jgi:hypothetical protein
VAEGFNEKFIDKLRHILSAAAVGHVDPAIDQIEGFSVFLRARS